MLDRIVNQAAQQWPEADAIACGGAVAGYAALAEQADLMVLRLAGLAGRRVGLAVSAGPQWVAAAAALDRLACQTFLLPVAATAEAGRLADRFDLHAVLHDSRQASDDRRLVHLGDLHGTSTATPPAAGVSSVVLLTSGTSGQPKAAGHTWASLASGVKPSDRLAGVRMALAYDLSRYAGLQVLLTALRSGARLSIPPSGQMPALIETIIADRVEFVSGTPTFWRMLLSTASESQLAAMPLRQITLGGEAVGQPILDALRRRFPDARITHIYASTEMGVCFSVHDGREGFPAAFLDSERVAVEMKVQAGRLWIRSKRAMSGYLGGQSVTGRWFDTGDAVEVVGDRVHFLGRESSRINVGGEKVYPEQVEEVIRQLDGVAEVRVSGRSSSIVGQLVQAEVVPAPGQDRDELRRRIVAHCRGRLPEFARPRLIEFVGELPPADTMKIARRPVEPT